MKEKKEFKIPDRETLRSIFTSFKKEESNFHIVMKDGDPEI